MRMLKKFIWKTRINIQRKKIFKLGTGVIICPKCIFRDSQNIYIGDYVYIGPEGRFFGLGGIEIKNGTIIGPRITIYSSNHNYQNPDYLPYDNRVVLKKVVIDENVWIGDNVMLIPGITIGEGSVIGLGSVVTKDIPPFSIVGGNPGQILGKRVDIDQYFKLKQDEKYYLKNKFV